MPIRTKAAGAGLRRKPESANAYRSVCARSGSALRTGRSRAPCAGDVGADGSASEGQPHNHHFRQSLRFGHHLLILRALADRRQPIEVLFEKTQSSSGAGEQLSLFFWRVGCCGQLFFGKATEYVSLPSLSHSIKAVGERRMGCRRAFLPLANQVAKFFEVLWNLDTDRPISMKCLATQASQSGCVVKFISGQVFGERTNCLIVSGRSDISVEGEGALLVANGESKRLVGARQRSARLLLYKGRRKRPTGRHRTRRMAESTGCPGRDCADVSVLKFGQQLELSSDNCVAHVSEVSCQIAVSIRRFPFHCVRDRQQIFHSFYRFMRRHNVTLPFVGKIFLA